MPITKNTKAKNNNVMDKHEHTNSHGARSKSDTAIKKNMGSMTEWKPKSLKKKNTKGCGCS